MISSTSLSSFPRQKLPDSKKTEKWWKECIDVATEILQPNNDFIRKSISNKQANYDLRVGKLNFEDFKELLDVYELGMTTFPKSFRHIGRGNAYINLLLGEEISRGNNFRVFISASDKMGISSKEETLKNLTLEHINNQLSSGGAELDQKALEKFQYYTKYEWQDLKESTAAKILKAEFQRNHIDRLFTECYDDALTAGEEILCAELHGYQPIARRCNPLNIYTLGSGNSNKLEDHDIIIEYQFLSIGQIIDRYYRFLTPKEVETLENRGITRNNIINGHPGPAPIYQGGSGDILILDPDYSDIFNRNWDAKGNIRVATVNWRSRRRLQELKYFDEFGNEQAKYVHEEYIPDESLGEEVKEVWVNEWWEGTKIGDDIYVNVKPIAYRGASLANVSKGMPNYIGQFYNINGSKVESMMDKIKPIDYQYDLTFYYRAKELSKHFGTPLLVNMSMVPSDWDPDTWLDYLANKGVGWLDPTQEILKGPSRGKSAGAFNTLTATKLDGSTANSIGLYTDVLLSLEDTLGKITGISPQREAQVKTSETVGGIQRALNQSAHITESWFAYHDNFKQRFLTKYLELVKYSYKKNPQVAQYFLSDAELQIVKDYDEWLESDYDVHITNAKKDNELIEMLKQQAQPMFQNQLITPADLIAIWKSESTQDIAKKLEESREKIVAEQQRLKEMDGENNAKLEEQKQAFETYKIEQENLRHQQKLENDYKIAELQAWAKNNSDDGNGIPDAFESEKFREKINFDKDKLRQDAEQKEKDRQHQSKETDKKIKAQKEIAKMKPKTTTK